MALNANACGAAVAAAVKAAASSVSPTAAITDAQLENIWKAAVGAIFAHLTANGVVAVPATGLISAAPGSPVTGAAQGTIS